MSRGHLQAIAHIVQIYLSGGRGMSNLHFVTPWVHGLFHTSKQDILHSNPKQYTMDNVFGDPAQEAKVLVAIKTICSNVWNIFWQDVSCATFSYHWCNLTGIWCSRFSPVFSLMTMVWKPHWKSLRKIVCTSTFTVGQQSRQAARGI